MECEILFSKGETKLVRKPTNQELNPKRKEPFRMEEDWFSFVVGLILALMVLFGLIKHVPC